MKQIVMLVPTSMEVDVVNVAQSLPKQQVDVIELATAQLEALLSADQQEDLLTAIVGQVAACPHDVVIVPGIGLAQPYAMGLNYAIATALQAHIVFVVAPGVQAAVSTVINPYMGKFAILGYLINQGTEDGLRDTRMPFLGTMPNQAVWLTNLKPQEPRVTPPYFRHNLITNARRANKLIVLPEGDEPRTLRAANICAEQQIARCLLLGAPQQIQAVAAQQGIVLHEQVTILDPATIRAKYVQPLFELRQAKGMTIEQAQQELQDNVMLGTMMLKLGDVDGLVSGAVHTTANTIRPALQVIKTTPDVKLISSLFFMCLPEQILMYGDCAINPNPTAEELADIAIQSADSALAFGMQPKVALLSYSTGVSGFGPTVDKVRLATELAHQKRPDLLIDGPLQYDAAIMPDVAALKAPQSSVAGKANVFIFPDLNAGNIAYKAVQRSANLVCIGPLLQGLKQPVNDLSRGCLIEDIVYTIALTAIQAAHA